MMNNMRLATLVLLSTGMTATEAWSFGVTTPSTMKADTTSTTTQSRRDWMQKASVLVGGAVASQVPQMAWADDEEAAAVTAVPEAAAVITNSAPEVTPTFNRMGGLLEKFQDGPRGFRMFAPSGWNKFEGEVGAYDTMWRDLVDVKENIKVSSTPVKSTTSSVARLGEVQQVGKSLAGKRDAKLIKASERVTDGILFYTFEFAINDGTHQLLQLCVNKGKIWSLTCSASERRWSKIAELYENVANSFYPTIV
jgi:photosystem II oxygen-evolving enhancer protein 2